MGTWGRNLESADDSSSPGTIVCVEVATVSTPDTTSSRRRIHRLSCGHAIAGRLECGRWTRENALFFTSGPRFWEWANCRRKRGEPLWIFSYSLSTSLTLTGFWGDMESGSWSLSAASPASPAKIRSERLRRQLSRPQSGVLVDSDPPTCLMAWHRDGWKIICLDLRNYLDRPLSALASLAALPISAAPSTESSQEERETLAEQACRVTLECVTRLVRWHSRSGLGRFGWTISGMAMGAFRHKYIGHQIELPPNSDDREFERRAYYPGRCEPFFIGEINHGRYYPPEGFEAPTELFHPRPLGPFTLLDSSSFYGAIGAFQSVPIRCVAEGDGWPDAEGTHPPIGEDYIAEVCLRSPCDEFPVRLTDRTVCARGNYTTVLAGPELARAARIGAIVHVGRWRLYECETALRAYGLGLWAERVAADAAGDGVISSVIKGMLARLHGKFLQRDNRWVVDPDEPAPGPWKRWHRLSAATGERADYRSIGWEVQRSQPAGDARHCFPAIAAFVTSWGREWLRGWIELAGRENVLYVSTDSLIVTQAGRTKLEKRHIIGDHGIGSLRVVVTADSLDIRGPNDYRLGAKVCLSGVPEGMQSCGSRPFSFAVRPSLRTILASRPGAEIAETETTWQAGQTQETHRLTEGGWLKPLTHYESRPQWAPIESPIPI